ncbi:MAG TPA: PAS domain-containing protein [Candidatus Didemnitutus sp.]|nr:PAS domain-containing protein [Candidatus Didemnitutus sp.]
MHIDSRDEQERLLERYEMACLATQMTVWEVDTNSNVVTWNAYLGIVFKHQRTVTTRDWWTLHIHPDDVSTVVRMFDEWRTSGEEMWVFEYRFRRGDGVYVWVQDHSMRIFDEKGLEIRRLGSMLDVSKYRAQRLELIKRNIQLGDVAQMIAHELRGPLTTLMGLATLAQSHDVNGVSSPLIDRIVEATGLLDAQVQHMISTSTGLQSCGMPEVRIVQSQAGDRSQCHDAR